MTVISCLSIHQSLRTVSNLKSASVTV